MDKQIIEEMAKVCCGKYNNGGCEIDGWVCTCKCKYYKMAETLYNKILPENAVVLTEAEYSDILSDEVETIKRDIAEYWATEDIEIVAKELQKDGYRKLDDQAICVLRKAKWREENIRKETAEKLLNKVEYEINGQTKAITDLLRKEYGVETK